MLAYVSACIQARVCACICVCECATACIQARVCACICVCACVSACIQARVCVCICVCECVQENRFHASSTNISAKCFCLFLSMMRVSPLIHISWSSLSAEENEHKIGHDQNREGCNVFVYVRKATFGNQVEHFLSVIINDGERAMGEDGKGAFLQLKRDRLLTDSDAVNSSAK